MGIVFSIPGERDVSQVSRGGGGGGGGGAASPLGVVKDDVRVAALRAGAPAVRVEAEPGQDMVVLQIAGGPELVLHPETARELMQSQAGGGSGAQRGAGGGEVAVPVQLGWQGAPAGTPGATRGALGQVLLSGFRLLTGARKDPAQRTVEALVKKFDAQVVPGVHALRPESLEMLTADSLLDAVPPAPAGAPTLVLIHGTFSSTFGTFSKLWLQHPQRVRELFGHYGGHVYALEHATLGLSPIENALALARALPDGATLHLLTHSRGGLVAEVLSRVCAAPDLPPAELDGFAARAEDVSALRELARLAREKRLRVARVVRVACPARGTLLASRRLDAYLSVLKWTLGLAGIAVGAGLLEFLGEVARQRLDPNQIPGLAAQVPDSALVRWLREVPSPIAGGLRVVAGDMQGDSLGSWLKTLMADAFYWTDNDLVVQTRSMYGGAPRADGAAFVLDRGGAVSHFAYFGNEDTARAITEALLRDTPAGFRAIGPLSWAGQDSSGVRAGPRAGAAAPDKPALVLVLLPGIAGSNLAVDGERVWLHGRLVNGLLRLKYRDGDGVRPDGVVGRVYDDLAAFLSRSHEVIEFAFDWRRPIEEEARRLGEVVQAALAARSASGQPVRLLAHSMGGLVARVMQLECPEVWNRLMSHPAARLLMLGTPNGGSWAPMQVLSGDDTFGNTLTAFGAPFQDDKARAMLANFPGLLQMQQELLDPDAKLDRAETWAALARQDLDKVQEFNSWHHDGLQLNVYRWGAPPQAVLDAAVALRRRLDKQRDTVLPRFADRLLLVLGSARRTPDGIRMTDQGLVYLDALDRGDGRVLDTSAMLPGVACWRTDCEHGTLAAHVPAFAAYLELLEQGRTAQLAAVNAPAGARGAGAGADPGAGAGAPAPAVRHVPSRPSREALAPPAPGDDLQPLAPPPAAQLPPGAALRGEALKVQVFNGDLAFVDEPLLIGHYAALGIAGAELAVDRLLGGSLTRALQAGLYPQEAGSQQIFVNTRLPDTPWQLPRPQAVVVVGLGAEGKLRPTDLVRSVRAGVLAWALRLAERPGTPAAFELAATLVGSGGLGVSAGQAAQLIAQGVHEANARLLGSTGASARVPAPPTVSRLVLVELYLDRATEAWRALKEVQDASPEVLALAPQIRRAASALERPLDSSYRGADYDLIVATTEPDASGDAAIAWRIDTKRARSEVRAKATQGRLLRQLVADGGGSGGGQGAAELGRTLFQLLVPLELERFLAGSTAAQLELDEGSAAIPWELLETPRDRDGDGSRYPWAIRTRLLRKLRAVDFRMQVSDAGRGSDVLIVGEPACPSGYPRLAGARREARSVAARLRAAGFAGSVRELIAAEDGLSPGPDAGRVISTLLERDWRVVHIAGHGEGPQFEGEEGPARRLKNPRGVVLSNGIFLGPREIQSMRVVPELVFVNCCYSGAGSAQDVLRAREAPLGSADSRPGFAANVAQELIRIGVRCVVATGWAVDDAAAEAFAATFYTALLRGRRFIDAVAEARLAAWTPGGGNTWGAYQCYGDPNWTLLAGEGDAQRPAPAPEAEFGGIASAPALVLALRSLETEAVYQGGSPAEKAARVQRLRFLADRHQAAWGNQGAVAEAFGRAFKAAGETASAIGWLRRAVQAGDGAATLRSSEDLYNLEARAAWLRVEAVVSRRLAGLKGRSAPQRAQALLADAQVQAAAREALPQVQAALDSLRLLNQLQRTAERENLCGSACKRLAQLLRLLGDPGADARLADMRGHYRSGWDLAVAAGEGGAFYPAMNVLAASVAAQEAGADVPALMQQVCDLVDGQRRLNPDFWNAAAAIELPMWQALSQGRLAQEQQALAAALDDLHDRVADASKWDSVLDQARFVFFGRLLDGRLDGDEAQAAQVLLGKMEGWVPAKP